MWFRPGNHSNNNNTNSTTTIPGQQSIDLMMDKFEKFRVSSFKKRLRGKKSPEKSPLASEKNSSKNEESKNVEVNNEVKQIIEETPAIDVVDHAVMPQSNLANELNRESSPSFDLIENISYLVNKSKLNSKKPKTDLPVRKIISKPILQDKVLLTDRKFKSTNRIVKSSSKTKIVDLEKKESIKRNGSSSSIGAISRKKSTNQALDGKNIETPKKHVRAHSTLNLNALYKLVSNSTGNSSGKKLTTEDFDRIRKQSLSEAASSAIAIATNKSVSSIVKGSDNESIPEKVDDDVCNNGVVLVKHGHLDTEEYVNNNNTEILVTELEEEEHEISVSANNESDNDDSSLNDENLNTTESKEDHGDERNSSESSPPPAPSVISKKAQKSSPSLTSRVAAKIHETTTNYKNRKSSNANNSTCNNSKVTNPSGKKNKNSKRSEVYKQISIERLQSPSVQRQPSDRRSDSANTSVNSSNANTSIQHNTSDLLKSTLENEANARDADTEISRRSKRHESKSAPVSVNRSESYKDRINQKKIRKTRRKTSDPLSLTKTNDEQSDVGISNANYTASSSSSLSSGGSIDSPSTSLAQLNNTTTGQHFPINQTHHHPHHNNQSNTPGSLNISAGTAATRQWLDSEDEDDFNEVDWSSNIASDILVNLSDAEKKRQEIINEIFQTERSHIRILRLLEKIFYLPLRDCGYLPQEDLHLLFPPALINLKNLHNSFEAKLKQRRLDHSYLVKSVGDLLVEMFEGQSGEELRLHAAQFCARQQIALEALKEKRRKDENLQRFLSKAESHKACRRLQLKDLLPTVLQRLTKYPLLFENLHKITKRVVPDDLEEAEKIKKALDSSKRILIDVNQAVKLSEDTHKLQTIQRKLDRSSFDKDPSNEFKNLDLTQYKLIHDGQLTLKKNPGVQLHGLLFESMMVLLHKQDDKYVLKYFQNTAASTAETNKLISPITYFEQQILVRQLATDKNTFFLILTKTSQMLELKAPSSSECKTWFKHISDAAEQYKPRSNKNSQEIADDPQAATIPHSNTKESLECTTTDRTSQQSNNSINNSVLAREHSLEKNKNNLLNNNINNISNNNNNNNNHNNNNNINNNTNKSTKINRDDNENDKTFTDSSSSDPRDSIYSNNSNNTRTLMQHCTLLEPSEIQISISPAHTAEPILLPGERLRRLDEKIKQGLTEKQKIICDMFRVPNEHFMAIADIASQPEAPKDSADIALAAYSQVQSLTEILAEYMTCTPEQEISAVSTSVCDKCHRKQLLQAEKNQQRSISPNLSSATNTPTTTTTTPTTATDNTVVQKENLLSKTNSDDTIIQEDDGYCEIDELRLPSIMSGFKHINNSNSNNTSSSTNNISNNGSSSQSELVKRQSTISSDSIPEESEQDIISQQNNDENNKQNVLKQPDENNETKKPIDVINLTLNTAEHIEINDTYDTLIPLNKSHPSALELEENSNRILCGPNRLSHVTSLEPTIPCSVLNSFVHALNSQISLLLPKINERDLERENLRKENQHLRELLNAMHDRKRVEENKETPGNNKTCDDNNEINID